jgi:hypothetical protein
MLYTASCSEQEACCSLTHLGFLCEALCLLWVADIFFKTSNCLRIDQSTCFQPGDKNYQITHSGLDAQVRFHNIPCKLHHRSG